MAILGQNTAGGSGFAGDATPARKMSSKFTLASASTLQELHAWVQDGSAGVEFIIHIYADNGSGSPGALVAYTNSIPFSSASLTAIGQTGFSVPLAAGDYWIGTSWKTNNGQVMYTGSGGTMKGKISGAVYDPPSDPYGTMDWNIGWEMSVWAVVGAAASPPVANFTGTPLSGPASLLVAFTDTSTNTPTSWAWDFGDGGTSTSQNPSHTYTVAGTYTVELEATNAAGSDTETKTDYVVVASDGLEGRVLIAFADGPLVADPTWTRIDDDVDLRVSEISIRQGRQTELDQTETSTATVTLHDRAGVFNPYNGSSPYYGDIDGKQISINLQNPVTSAWSEQFRGVIDDYSYTFSGSPAEVVQVRIEAVGVFDYLAGVEMLPGEGAFGDTPPAGDSTGIVFYEDGPVQTRLDQLAADAGLDASRCVFFTGNVDVQETKYDPGDSILVAMRDAADAEFAGGIANLYEDRHGRVVFHGRFARFDPEGVAAANANWDFHRWYAGDGTAIQAEPTLAQIRPPLQWSRPRRMIYNAAIAYPRYPIRGTPAQSFDDDDIPAQITTDATSITDYGYRGWSARDLITLAGTTTGNNAAAETKLFADFYVANYALPRTRINALTFKSIHPDDPRAASTWALICGADVSDVVNLSHDYPGGGLLFEDFYIEGREMTIRPLNPQYDMVELSLNVSPSAYYTTDVFS